MSPKLRLSISNRISAGSYLRYGYSASRYKFVPGVQIRTGYAGNYGLLPQPINVKHGKVCLQMVLRTFGILIFIIIPSSGDDIIVSAAGGWALLIDCCVL